MTPDRAADPADLVAASARQLAGDWPLLLAVAGSPPPVSTGTIGRQSNVHGIPGGTEHHSLSREVRDALADYAERTRDAAGLTARWSDIDPTVNAQLLATHAQACADLDPGPCAGHAMGPDDTGPRVHATVEQHLACLAHRVRLRVDPPAARPLVGLCPSPVESTDTGYSAQTCERPLRTAGGVVRCPLGHVHDTATVRDLAAHEAGQRTHTLRDITRMSLTLWGQRVHYDRLEKAIRAGRLASTRDPDGRHLVRVQDVAAIVVHGR